MRDKNTRREHSWHKICSYLGAFPSQLASEIIDVFTEEGDIIFDPFSGRGTTLLESRIANRIPIASDLNPIAIAITKAKNCSVTKENLFKRIDSLEQLFDLNLYFSLASIQSKDIQLIFHKKTLAQLCYLQQKLVDSDDQEDIVLTAAILGILHGGERKDGSSIYASMAMPNTFSMSPSYLKRFAELNNLYKKERNVFELLKEKIKRMYINFYDIHGNGIVIEEDVKKISLNKKISNYKGKVKLILTSPPYLSVLNYAKQNWIRMWFLKKDVDAISKILDDKLNLLNSIEFLEKVTEQLYEFISEDGIIIYVIGDVKNYNSKTISPARELIKRFHMKNQFEYIGCLNDFCPNNLKMTKIWKDHKGEATNIDRILVLSKSKPVIEKDKIYIDAIQEYAINFAGIN